MQKQVGAIPETKVNMKFRSALSQVTEKIFALLINSPDTCLPTLIYLIPRLALLQPACRINPFSFHFELFGFSTAFQKKKKKSENVY